MIKIGILALQGDFARHAVRLGELGAETVLVRSSAQLEGVGGLVLPGGESTAMLKLMEDDLRLELEGRVRSGLPTLATCAGLILLAKRVENPSQRSLGLLDLDVTRNGYGRQLDSFVEDLEWNEAGQAELRRISNGEAPTPQKLQGVFIRAPRVTRVGPSVSVLINHGAEPVLVKQGRILAATFHPELSERAVHVHRYWLNECLSSY